MTSVTSLRLLDSGGPTVDPSNPRALKFATGARAEFPHPIGTVVYVDDGVDARDSVVAVVLLDVPHTVVFNRNVFAVRRDGRFAWQITDKGVVGANSPYTAIAPDGARLAAYNWSGVDLWLDPQTGAVLDGRLSRF